MGITREEIAKGLKKLGLKRGDIVLLHSTLSSLGYVEGGADAVIDAFLDVLGEEGSLCMPTMSHDKVFDIEKSPSYVGYITEVFRTRPGVLRSRHPTHSMAAYGAKAEEITRDHEKCQTAMGPETPYGRIADLGGYICHLGVDQDRNTTLHTAEIIVRAAYLKDRPASYIDENGEVKRIVMKYYPGPHRNFIGIDPRFRRAGIMRIGKIGNAVVRLMKAREMIDETMKALREDPAAVLCDNPNCADCVWQRGKIKAAHLAREDFILSAVGEEISPVLATALKTLEGEGIRHIEIGAIENKTLDKLSHEELNKAKETIQAAGVKVSAVNFPQPPEDLKQVLDIAEEFETEFIILAYFPGVEELVAQAETRGKTILLENQKNTGFEKSRDCLETLRSLGPAAGLAFNPANFAIVGEKPFSSRVSPPLRKLARQLYINDATFDGRYQLPGYGNAEIKELISILRCRSFSGFFTIKPCLGGGVENFKKVAAAFWNLLDNM